uniref:Uncharacterized protein n=1 Tax=Lepeophtheirus salmonis TaxID=72036 RepID=A0A0K2UFQ4_LEPSM
MIFPSFLQHFFSRCAPYPQE